MFSCCLSCSSGSSLKTRVGTLSGSAYAPEPNPDLDTWAHFLRGNQKYNRSDQCRTTSDRPPDSLVCVCLSKKMKENDFCADVTSLYDNELFCSLSLFPHLNFPFLLPSQSGTEPAPTPAEHESKKPPMVLASLEVGAACIPALEEA